MTGALDGNAIAGSLVAAFGREMTTAIGVCSHCGARSALAELRVYVGGPGAVGRCRSCDSLLMVIVDVRGVACVDVRGLASLEPAPDQ
jgi:hypothetical protein